MWIALLPSYQEGVLWVLMKYVRVVSFRVIYRSRRNETYSVLVGILVCFAQVHAEIRDHLEATFGGDK